MIQEVTVPRSSPSWFVMACLAAWTGLSHYSASAQDSPTSTHSTRPISDNIPPLPEPSATVGQAATPRPPIADSATPPVVIPSPPSILGAEVQPIDLSTALRLAGVENPDLNLARQRVVEATALRQLAAAQFLPTINVGTNYDSHTGPLQQSNGNILSVQRSALYVGAGANAIAAGTVNIPGVFLGGNIGTGIFNYLESRQLVIQREFSTLAIRNQVFLSVAVGYAELLRAEGIRAVSLQARDEAREVARLTADYAATGQGRKADADRATTELARREGEVLAAEGLVLTSSAELCRLLNLDPSIRLHPTDAYVVPMPIVPDPQPLSELIAIGLLRRPELVARRAAIREAFLSLENAKVLPFSPTVLVGFSAGGFGGGSNLVKPVFGSMSGRTDLDVVAYWTLRNLGVGNAAMIKGAKARLGASRFQEIAALNQVRADVAVAYARTHARYAQIGTTEAAVRSSQRGFREDYDLTIQQTGRKVLPIELLNNFRLLNDSRREYLDAIVDYNRAQFELYVALGQPPADALARPVPTEGLAPSGLPGTQRVNTPSGIDPSPNVPEAAVAPAPAPTVTTLR
ncbi:TolC family protein [Tundrisphaera lichenicola]|uniref:TolC family protein n=1 Tax=Tundrisphaera lichenicola TaxID=2029860 RepID=UPI003EBCD082